VAAVQSPWLGSGRDEAQQWRADAILSTVVAGALTGFGLVASGRAGLADYVDGPRPGRVAVLVPTPLRLLRSGTIRLLEGEPSAEISDPCARRSRRSGSGSGWMSRSSGTARPEAVRRVDFVVGQASGTSAREDEVRRAPTVSPVGLDVWAYVGSTDRALVE
jgi:hypothetical protein